jgi:lipooligosaccharide transport system ATP-binding protein
MKDAGGFCRVYLTSVHHSRGEDVSCRTNSQGGHETVLRAMGLRKRYGGREAVAGVDLSLASGRCLGLLGPNGAGKTTTLRMLLGLVSPDEGTIEVLGLPVPSRSREARQRIGVVPQFDNLDPDFTVRENLVIYGRYFDLKHAEIQRRIPALLEFAGLGGRAENRLQTLSGGMRRRLMLARALINDPQLIILDEPTTGLDPQARHVIWQGLRKLVQQGKTCLLTTHFMEEAERLCDEIKILDYGKVIASGHPRALIAEHIEPSVVEIYGDELERWRLEHASTVCQRHEQAGETLFCYCQDEARVLGALHGAGLRYLHRPANLEDVFLKLTGRELRD